MLRCAKDYAKDLGRPDMCWEAYFKSCPWEIKFSQSEGECAKRRIAFLTVCIAVLYCFVVLLYLYCFPVFLFGGLLILLKYVC